MMNEQNKYTADFPCFPCSDVVINYNDQQISLQAIKIDFNKGEPVSLVVAIDERYNDVRDRLIRFVISFYCLPKFLQIVVTNYCIEHQITINDLFNRSEIFIDESSQLVIDFWTVVFKQIAQFYYNKRSIEQLPQLRYLLFKYNRVLYDKFINQQKIKLTNQQKMIDQLVAHYDSKRSTTIHQSDLFDQLLDLL